MDERHDHYHHHHDHESKAIFRNSQEANPYENFDPERNLKKSWKASLKDRWDYLWADPIKERARQRAATVEAQVLERMLESETSDNLQRQFQNFIIRRPQNLFPLLIDTDDIRFMKFKSLLQSYNSNEVPCFSYSRIFNSARASICAYYIMRCCRRMTNLHHLGLGHAFTTIPSVVFPGIMAPFFYEMWVERPIILGKINCSLCANLRGAVLSGLFCGVYPVVVSTITSYYIGHRYDTIALPENYLASKQGIKYFFESLKKKIRPYKGRFLAVFVVNTLVGYFMSLCQMYQYFNMYEDLAKRMGVDEDLSFSPDESKKGEGYDIRVPQTAPDDIRKDVKDRILDVFRAPKTR